MLFGTQVTYGQGMAISSTGAAANTSAMLDVNATTAGMLAPRMTTAQRTAISSPASGLLVYDMTLNAFYYNSGTSSSPVWTAAGNIAGGPATGDMLYWNGTGWAALNAGSSGQVLTLLSGIPTWVSLPSYTITASSGTNGTVSPAGTTTLNVGASQVYTITPSSGYSVSSITVDGSTVSPVSTYTFAAVSGSHTIAATFASSTLTIGQVYGGGVIGYLLLPGDAGYSSTVQHGLIVAVIDQSSGAQWGCAGATNGAAGTAIGTGAANTTAILSHCTTTGIAAYLCHNYTGGGFTDWYLPSKDELNQFYVNRTAIATGASLASGNGFVTSNYWCSSENASVFAWYQTFLTGAQTTTLFKNSAMLVRAARSF